jgi:hypothetical protein
MPIERHIAAIVRMQGATHVKYFDDGNATYLRPMKGGRWEAIYSKWYPRVRSAPRPAHRATRRRSHDRDAVGLHHTDPRSRAKERRSLVTITYLTEEQARAIGATHYKVFTDGSRAFYRVHPLEDRSNPRIWQMHLGRSFDTWIACAPRLDGIIEFDPPPAPPPPHPEIEWSYRWGFAASGRAARDASSAFAPAYERAAEDAKKKE